MLWVHVGIRICISRAKFVQELCHRVRVLVHDVGLKAWRCFAPNRVCCPGLFMLQLQIETIVSGGRHQEKIAMYSVYSVISYSRPGPAEMSGRCQWLRPTEVRQELTELRCIPPKSVCMPCPGILTAISNQSTVNITFSYSYVAAHLDNNYTMHNSSLRGLTVTVDTKKRDHHRP